MSTAHPGPTYQLQFPQLQRELQARADETLYECARRHGLRIVAACGGRGVCGSCLVRVREGEVQPRLARVPGGEPSQPSSAAARAPAGRKRWIRACQFAAVSNCVLEIAPRSLAAVVRAEADPTGTEVLALHPAVRPVEVVVVEPSLRDPRADAERITDALIEAGVARPSRVDWGLARQLPQQLRDSLVQGRAALRAWLRDEEVVALDRAGSRGLGLAVDLGTTNIAAFLVDLESGERLASLGMENPQVAWGADVISRINAAINDPTTAIELRRATTEALNAMAHDLCQTLGLSTRVIVEVALCANTAMHHLLLGLPVRQLGKAPFVAAISAPLDIRARELGLEVAAGAWVHVLGGVGGFVGGDHLSALLATEPHWSAASASLVMDIGTNTEISVIHAGKILSASAPSGPALEGGHISCGMRAASGAIEKVSLLHDRLHVETIGGKPAVGLCGSGVLDAMASLLRGQLVNDKGRIVPEHARVTQTPVGLRLVRLARAVSFSQHDVRAVQLAKAAIRTATDLLLEEAGVEPAQLGRFIIAGAFGAYIRVQSGIDIGLFPALPIERFLQLGNAAGAGVRQAVASVRARARAAEIASTCRYVELSSRTGFQQRFLHHIGFHGLFPARTLT